jgi:NitT/TauT family transport system permease protein
MATQALVGNHSAVSSPFEFDVDEEERARARVRRLSTIGRWAVGLSIFVLWEVLTRIKVIDPYFFSSPSLIAQTAYKAATQGSLWTDIWFTSSATILGFVAGVSFGALLGLSTWWSNVYGNVLEPYLVMFNAVPKLALAPVLIIILGIGFSSKVALAVAMCIVPTAIAAYSGVKSIDPDLETLLFSLGAKHRHVFTKVVVPWALPWIVSSLRINIGLALAGTIVGEFVASQSGVGRMILYAGQVMDINLVWVGVVVLSILAMVMYWGVSSLEKHLLKGIMHGAQTAGR